MDLTNRKLGKTEKKRFKEFISKHGNRLLCGGRSEFSEYIRMSELARTNGLNHLHFIKSEESK